MREDTGNQTDPRRPAAAATTRLAASNFEEGLPGRDENNNRKQIHVLIHTENHFKKLNVLKVDDYVKVTRTKIVFKYINILYLKKNIFSKI